MPEPDEPYYCSQQIHVPPDLPDILKQFTKAAIKTQPTDILAWSSAYVDEIIYKLLIPMLDLAKK